MITEKQTTYDIKEAPPLRRLTTGDILDLIERAEKRPYNFHPGTWSMTVRYDRGIITFALLDYWDSDMLLKIETLRSIAEDRASYITDRINKWLRAGEEWKHGKAGN